ncbi:hypothetical protein ABZ845_13640 [Streptomyces sp. NPDC047022]|uniref:hypothetical protein n=1 Tax=Streptomyces sp. NPDC047022 TaxID=3155737 RepID=UPI00340E435C
MLITSGLALYILASAAASGAAVRLLLGILTVYAARKALGHADTPRDDPEAAERLRAHRRSVLRALLNCLRNPG